MELILRNLLDAGTSVIADVFDSMNHLPLVLDNDLFPITGPGTRFVGPSYTIAGAFQKWTGKIDRTKMAAIDEILPGAVAVWAGNDMKGVCCFGDLLAEAMKARGCAGVVVDGGIRDLAYLRKLKLPMIARYSSPASSLGRWQVTDRQVPVRVRGALGKWVTVHSGDVVVADDDGVIIVPQNLVNIVSARVREWASEDSEAREDIRHGTLLLEALKKYGHL